MSFEKERRRKVRLCFWAMYIPDINVMLKEHRYLMHSSNDNSTIRSWNIKRWIIEHITKYLITKLQLNVN
jgi:hypothetical protein